MSSGEKNSKEEWVFSEIAAHSFYGGYAELFETENGEDLEKGYFVTVNGRKIRKATAGDKYILGVTSNYPLFLGNNGDVTWKDKYVTDQWGTIQYENGKPIINSLWDKNKAYTPRVLRPEWVAVSLIGQVLVRDDGTCRVNSYCVPNNVGIATAAARGYRVLERKSEGQLLILLKAVTLHKEGFA